MGATMMEHLATLVMIGICKSIVEITRFVSHAVSGLTPVSNVLRVMDARGAKEGIQLAGAIAGRIYGD
jgi:hypothetical protein